MSGWAVTAFVLSLIGILVGLFWTWWPLLVPLAMGVGVLVLVPAGTRRGRVLAGWAIGISLLVGSCSFVMHSQMRSLFAHMAGDMLAALASKGDGIGDAARDDALRRWLAPAAVNAGVLEGIKARYQLVEAARGPYAGSIDAGSVFDGTLAMFVPPSGALEFRDPDMAEAPAVVVGSAAWVRAEFRDGPVWIALVVQDADKGGFGLENVDKGTGIAAILQDMRFFRVTPAKAQDGP